MRIKAASEIAIAINFKNSKSRNFRQIGACGMLLWLCSDSSLRLLS